ncbi:MAG TPA: hypothetical protein VKC51_07085, partial [Lacunisphaera sp.]|nr:hypothetical protein [Lacunisphaera sp.]
MDQSELEQCYAALGVQPGATLDEVERAFMQKNFALLKGKAGAADEAERGKLRSAHDALAAHLREQQKLAEAANPRKRPRLAEIHPPKPPPRGLLTAPMVKPRDPRADEFALFSFDNWKVNVIVPPLLLALAWLVTVSPLGMLLTGFHVWMHEFGHATAAWMCGFRATPLPFGWTPVEPEHSNFVYSGLLLMFGILFVAGWRERKVWPMIAAVALAALQFHMTWRMRELDQEFWWSAFGGVGGEFYLSALFMAFFFVQLPEKFKWGACRYVFFLIGASAFVNIYLRWDKIYHGLEEIPFGSMINGEGDQGGDMNKLMDGFGWTKAMIRRNYHLLGNGCLLGLGIT